MSPDSESFAAGRITTGRYRRWIGRP
jgi:hypothetical protein